MNRKLHAVGKIVSASILLCWLTLAVLGQSSGGSYRITSSVVSGGGASSTGNSNLTIDATSGEAAAVEQLVQSPQSLKGGFWPTTLVTAPTAANGSISGRIVTNEGTPVSGAVINL